mgnify:CR=1 FL=1
MRRAGIDYWHLVELHQHPDFADFARRHERTGRGSVKLFSATGARSYLEAEYVPGDALVFGMFMLHGSLKNTTNRYRISCDTRFQLAGEPVDERWVGRAPSGHGREGKRPRNG